jgi:hypothetical protein
MTSIMHRSSARLLLALLQQYAVAPRILARDNLKLWHTIRQRHVCRAMGCAPWCTALAHGRSTWPLTSR